MKRLTPLLLSSASILTGCAQFDDSRLEARQRRMAHAAYAVSPGACNGMPHSVDYAKGFEEGYYDVASGGDGCPPPLPPKKYWSATYNSPVGQEHVKAWFQGFRDGAAAAKAEGVASYGTIYVSDEHRHGGKTPPGATPPAAPLVPKPVTQPIPPPSGFQQVPVMGPMQLQQVPLLPPNSTGDGTPLKPPMSDAQKAPPLKDVQNPPPPVPPPSARRPEVKAPEPMIPMPMASVPLPISEVRPAVASVAKSEPTTPTIMPVSALPGANMTAVAIPAVAIPAVAAPIVKTPVATAEPVRLKLPELELPAGFTPEAGLGEPKTTSR